MDIQHTLTLISGYGLTDADIGERIDAPQSIVTRLRNGVHKSTFYERGLKIAALLEEIENSNQKKAEAA